MEDAVVHNLYEPKQVEPKKVSAENMLRSFIERIEAVQVERDDLGEDIKAILKEATAKGFNAKAIRTILKLRKIEENERKAQEAVVDEYMYLLGME